MVFVVTMLCRSFVVALSAP
ncbi:hypothetical protein B9J84_14520 [Vibrio sp. V03_P4A6T147]|nr:hypothetical protein B9J84_14520 [Vibrio sp. V03_P4A6T147]